MQNKYWLIIILVAACILAGTFYAFLYLRVKDLSTIVSEAEFRIAVLLEEERAFSVAFKDIEDAGADIKLLNHAFVNEDTFIDFLRLMEEIAAKASVKFDAESARLPQAANEEASIDFSLAGEFSGILKFFTILDEQPFSGIIESLEISQKDAKSGALRASAKYFIYNFSIK